MQAHKVRLQNRLIKVESILRQQISIINLNHYRIFQFIQWKLRLPTLRKIIRNCVNFSSLWGGGVGVG